MKGAIVSCIIANAIIYISYSIYNLSFSIKDWTINSRESFSITFSCLNLTILILHFLSKLMFEQPYKK